MVKLNLELFDVKEDNKMTINKKDIIIDELSSENKKLLNEIENIKEKENYFTITENDKNDDNEKLSNHKLIMVKLNLELFDVKEDNKMTINKKDIIIDELSSENKKL